MRPIRNVIIYKGKKNRCHDNNISRKEFEVGQKIFLLNSRLWLFMGKLRSKWSGPLELTQVNPYGGKEVNHKTKSTFKVNGQCLKSYIDRDFDKHKVSINLENHKYWKNFFQVVPFKYNINKKLGNFFNLSHF